MCRGLRIVKIDMKKSNQFKYQFKNAMDCGWLFNKLRKLFTKKRALQQNHVNLLNFFRNKVLLLPDRVYLVQLSRKYRSIPNQTWNFENARIFPISVGGPKSISVPEPRNPVYPLLWRDYHKLHFHCVTGI